MRKLLRAITETAGKTTEQMLKHLGGDERFVRNHRLSARMTLDWEVISTETVEEVAEEVATATVAEIVAEITQDVLGYARCDRPIDAEVDCLSPIASTTLALELQNQIRSLKAHCSSIRIIVGENILPILDGYSSFHRVIPKGESVQLPLIGVFDGCKVLFDKYASDHAPIIIGFDWFTWDAKRKITDGNGVDPMTMSSVATFQHDYTFTTYPEKYRLIKPRVLPLVYL